MLRPAALSLLLVTIFSLPAAAGKYNKALSPGDAAPDWQRLEGTDGELHSLADLAEMEVVVIAFTCNTCPYAVDCEDRLIALAKECASAGGKAALVAINPNRVKDDLMPAMRERAKAKNFNFLYLHDTPEQSVAKSYGASYTPEFVVLDKDRRVVYLGALDDSPDGKNVTKRYVAEAVAATLAGKAPSIAETPAVGCAVRYARQRRAK